MKLLGALSPTTYIIRNFKRILPVFIILFVVTVVMVTASTILLGIKEGAVVYCEGLRYFTVILPRKEAFFKKDFIDSLASNENVEKTIQSRAIIFKASTIVSHFPFPILAVATDEIPYMMKKFKLVLSEGKLPEKGANEVIIHEIFAKSNSITIGSEFGWDADYRDWMPGRFKIVGIMSGPTPSGFTSYEYLASRYPFAIRMWERLLVFPSEGRKDQMDEFLKGLEDVKVYDYNLIIQEFNASFEKLTRIINFVSILIMLSIALVVGLLNSVFFSSRYDEFAILLAMGYKNSSLIGKVLLESLFLTVFAWFFGLLATSGLIYCLRAFILQPRGIDIPQFIAAPFLFSALLPVIAIFFSSWTVFRRLTSLDPILVIEKR